MSRVMRARILLVGVVLLSGAAAQAVSESGSYVGTTPCDAPVREFLEIPAKAPCDFIHWDLWLALGVNGHPPTLHVTVQYGVEGKALRKIKRDGKWTVGQGAAEHPDAVVYGLELRGREMRLWRVGPNTVYFLNNERNLLVGNSGYSYALSTQVGEQPRPPGEAPELAYTLTAPASGPEVFGIFEGRTPCGLSQVLGIAVPAGCIKLKWRLTLFQDANTHVLANYRLEGSLFPAGPREGPITWMVSTSFNRDATVLVLEPPPGGQKVYLMRGDDNVFFFVDRTGSLGLGDREFSYVLNRRAAQPGG